MQTPSSEHLARMAAQYEKRMAYNRKWAKKHYDLNRADVARSRLIQNIQKGHTPMLSTLKRIEIDRDALVEAWCSHVAKQPRLSERAQKFHRFLTGSDWVPTAPNVN
ncbi:hypothetical protein OAO87_01160 [bacterium]|nr:hypothetical protein [bacterium]